MKISMKNFGYIKSGVFDSNDLTIIFGKNNSGKTYLSYAAYIFANEIKEKLHVFASSNLMLDKLLSPYDSENSVSLRLSDIISEDTILTINAMSSYFLADNFNLDRSHFHDAVVNFDFKNLIKKAKVAEFEFAMTSKFVDKNVIVTKKKNKDNITITTIQKSETQPLHESNAVSFYFYQYQITEAIINEILDLDIKKPFVITSERTGVEMFYKEMDSNRSDITEKISLRSNSSRNHNSTDSDAKSIARYSKPIADNIRTIRSQQEIRKLNSEISKLDDFIHLRETLNKIIKGNFKLSSNGDTVYVMNGREDIEMPIHAASSSIKSMTMVELYINHIAAPGETLIIDEPELNLHPDNQIAMAELIVRLVNLGVKVIMTTHSDYIVREINNRIKLFSASKDNKIYKRYVKADLDVIDHEKVSVYYINEKGKINKSVVCKTGMENVIFDDIIIDSAEKEELISSLVLE